MTPEEIAHPLDESLGDIHEIALALAAARMHYLGEKLAKAHEAIQQYLIANDVDAERARAEEAEAALVASEAREKALAGALREVDSYWSEDFGGPEDMRAMNRFTMRTIKLWKRFRAALAAYDAAHPKEKEEVNA